MHNIVWPCTFDFVIKNLFQLYESYKDLLQIILFHSKDITCTNTYSLEQYGTSLLIHVAFNMQQMYQIVGITSVFEMHETMYINTNSAS